MLLRVFIILLFLILIISLPGCERISQKIEDKINEKINKSIDESSNRIDTLFRKGKLDSIKFKIDSSILNTKKKVNKK
jgi:hypothetical protein